MSIYSAVYDDLLDIFNDPLGFAEEHTINGQKFTAIVHAANLTVQTTNIDLATFEADVVVIVRAEDFGNMPSVGAVFFLDDTEFRVLRSSRLGGHGIKIILTKPEY